MSNIIEYYKMLATMEELNIGIVPRSVYQDCLKQEVDPFKGLSKEEEKKLKRKFRKLKRKIKKERPNRQTTNRKVRDIIFWRFVDLMSKEDNNEGW